MPRIYDSASNPVDFCKKHFPKTEGHAELILGNKGEGPDGRGNCFAYDAEHPSYDDFGDYQCAVCHRTLSASDD
jgi:hypothetical protein